MWIEHKVIGLRSVDAFFPFSERFKLEYHPVECTTWKQIEICHAQGLDWEGEVKKNGISVDKIEGEQAIMMWKIVREKEWKTEL